MKCIKKLKIQLIFPFLVFIPLVFAPIIVQALSDLYIGASTKISICGNGEIEGGEDCEGINLNNKICESLGFGPGILSCDIACSFDTYNCGPAPTITPTLTLIPTLTPTLTPTPTLTVILTPTLISTSPTSVLTLATTSVPIVIQNPSPTSVPLSTATPTPSLPQTISFFDINGDGKILITELYPAVKKWVDEWKNILKNGDSYQNYMSCDINKDKRCDLLDFSILLSYVET